MASSHQSSFESWTSLHGNWSHPHAVCKGWRWPSNSSWEHQRTFHGCRQKGRMTHVLFLFLFFSFFSHIYFINPDFCSILSCLCYLLFTSLIISYLLSFCLSICPLFCSSVLAFDCPTSALLSFHSSDFLWIILFYVPYCILNSLALWLTDCFLVLSVEAS